MKLRVLHGYRVAFGQQIEAGEYDAADPALFGRADYLVANRHAEIIPDAPASEPAAPAEAPAVSLPPPKKGKRG